LNAEKEMGRWETSLNDDVIADESSYFAETSYQREPTSYFSFKKNVIKKFWTKKKGERVSTIIR